MCGSMSVWLLHLLGTAPKACMHVGLAGAVMFGTEPRMLPQVSGHRHPGLVELVRDHPRQGQQGSHCVQHHVRFLLSCACGLVVLLVASTCRHIALEARDPVVCIDQ